VVRDESRIQRDREVLGDFPHEVLIMNEYGAVESVWPHAFAKVAGAGRGFNVGWCKEGRLLLIILGVY